MATYILAISTDAYHASRMAINNKVIKRSGATPVKWRECDWKDYDTIEAAEKALAKLADRILGEKDSCSYEYDESVEEIRNDGRDTSWYKGEGYYEEGEPVYLLGDHSFSYDVMTYSIEEAEEE